MLVENVDGDGSFVDRVNIDNDSYSVESTRLSITGGIQPGAFRQAFKDPKDPQGLQGRFLYAIPQVKPAKRIKGECLLKEILPALYQWLDQLPSGSFTLSEEADNLYSQYVEAMGIEAEKSDNAALRAWLRKLCPQMLRQAMCVHLLHCFFERERNLWIIETDILQKSIEACAYYRSAFEVVTEKVGESDTISSIFIKIYDNALNSPEGLSIRDVYRGVSAISRRAEKLGREVRAYTIELLGQLVNMGKGVLEKKGRFYKFFAKLPEPNISNSPGGMTDETPATPLDNIEVGLSAEQQVSTVTPRKIPIEIPIEPNVEITIKPSIEIPIESPVETDISNVLATDTPQQATVNGLSSDGKTDIDWLLKMQWSLENSESGKTENEWIDLVAEMEKVAHTIEHFVELYPDYWDRVWATYPTVEEPSPSSPASEPLTEAQEPLTEAVEPLTKAQEPLTEAVEPLTEAQEPLTEAVEPLTEAQEPLTEAIEPETKAIPTLLELKALILACETWGQIENLSKKHPLN
jgi:hypothetical protein